MLTDKTFLEKSSVAGVAAIALALLALSWLALRPAAMPAPLPANAPAADFSAARAAAHVAVLAQAPRPIASAANAEARHYLVEQIRALGLAPQVQTATVRKATVDILGNVHATVAVVNNILVRTNGTRPGHASRPATLYASHYDSGERSLGAAHGGAAVAAMLETLRALQAGTPLANDLVFLFADGDDTGAMGMRGFAEQHPWAEQIRLALVFDGGGSGGPVMLFDSSGEDADAIDGWANAMPQALGSSFINSVTSLAPGSGAMGQLGTVANGGLRFANIEGGTGQLGGLDTAERLDGGTLQQLGDTMLGLARHYGQRAPSRAEAGKQLYFTVPLIGVVHYSTALIWPLTRLVCLMFFGLCCVVVRHGEAESIDIVHGAIGFLFIGAMLALSVFSLQEWLPAETPAYLPLVYGAGHQDRWYLLGFALLASAVFIVLQALLQRRLGVPAAALGAMLLMVLLLMYASWQMPGASYALTWPLFGAIIGFGSLYVPRVAAWPRSRRVLILLAGAAPGVILIAPLVRDVFTLLTVQRMNLPIAVLALLLGLCTALLAALRAHLVVGALALGCAASIAAARAQHPYDGELPQPNRMVYYKDTPTWRSYWMLPAASMDSWTRHFFPNATEPHVPVEVLGYGGEKMWVAPAPRNDVKFPYIEVLKDDDGDTVRHVEFMLRSDNAAPTIEIWINGSNTFRTELNGMPITSQRTRAWSLSLHGMGNRRLHFSLDLEPGASFQVAIQERIPGLPPNDAPARSADMRPVLTPVTATTIAFDKLLFR